MNLFKKQTNTANNISHVLINKKKRKCPEPVITIRQIEEKDVNEVRQLLHDHFNSLTLPAVVYWSIQHIYDLLVIIAINYIFFLDIRKIFSFLGIFLIYLYIRAKLEFLRHIRKDCPDLNNLYKSYVNVDGCNFWVAEVIDCNSDSVSRTTCSDIYERERVINEQEKEEQMKVLSGEKENCSIPDVNSGDDETIKYEKGDEKSTDVLTEMLEKCDQKVYGHSENTFENEYIRSHGEEKFDEHNGNVEREVGKEEEKKKKDEYIEEDKNDKSNEHIESKEDKKNDEIEAKDEEGKVKNQNEHYEKKNNVSCEQKFEDSKNKSTNDLLEEMKINKKKEDENYTRLYYETGNKNEENKESTRENTFCSLNEYKVNGLKSSNKGEIICLNLKGVNSNNNEGFSNNNNSRAKDDEELSFKSVNKKIVGCVGIVPFKGDNTIAQLVRMVVKKDNRRMRIGSRLLTQLENFAHEQNYKELKVFTNNLNTDSLYFVKQHGFTLSQIVRRGLMRGDLLIWSKILNKDNFCKFNSTDMQSCTTNILD